MPIYTSTAKKKKSIKADKPPKETKPRRKVNIWAVVLVISCVLFLSIIFPFISIFRDVFVGVFGLVIYPLLICVAIVSIAMLRQLKYKVNVRYLVYTAAALVCILAVLHLVLTSSIPLAGYGRYLADTFASGQTAGGVIMSLLTYPIAKLLTVGGAYLVFAMAMCIFISLAIEYVARKRMEPIKTDIKDVSFVPFTDVSRSDVPITLDSVVEHNSVQVARAKLGLTAKQDNVISSNMPSYNTYTQPKEQTVSSTRLPSSISDGDDIFIRTTEEIKPYYVKPPIDKMDYKYIKTVYEKPKKEEPKYDYTDYTIQRAAPTVAETSPIREDIHITETYVDRVEEDVTTVMEDDYLDAASIDRDDEYATEDAPLQDEYAERDMNDNRHSVQVSNYQPKQDDDVPEEVYTFDEPCEMLDIEEFESKVLVTPRIEEVQKVQKVYDQSHLTSSDVYIRPPISMLRYMAKEPEIDSEVVRNNIDKLEKALEDFKVPAKVIAVQRGPAVTRYELSMPSGISVKKVQMHADDIAMVLASNGSIRIEAPIPGKNAVGIEVPNDRVTPVALREVFDNKEFAVRPSPLNMSLGKDINGDIKFCNLEKLVHIIVAGSTGSGKSVCLNAMIMNILYKAGPSDIRLILIDPKRVEFSIYEGLPHLLLPHIVTEKDQAINALTWAVKEMERRYILLQKHRVVNIKDYNGLTVVQSGQSEKLPYIVIIIDELADLMVDKRKELEERLMKLAQKARAAGIHLVVATQRPSVDVITGTIKANFGSRIAFALTNYADSRTVIDGGGAEKLLGKGDMLFKPFDRPEPIRVQGAYVTTEEVANVVDFVKKNNRGQFDANIEKEIIAVKEEYTNNSITGEMDPVLKPALKMFLEMGVNSTTMIQRRFGVGFLRAGRIVDQMEYHKFVGPLEGNKPRKILINMEDYHNIFPED